MRPGKHSKPRVPIRARLRARLRARAGRRQAAADADLAQAANWNRHASGELKVITAGPVEPPPFRECCDTLPGNPHQGTCENSLMHGGDGL